MRRAATTSKPSSTCPADLYPTLTLDVIDSDNQMATVTVNRTEAFEAGTLYKKAVDAPQFAPIAAPSLVWPNQDMNEPHDITKCGTDYEANIQITVPGGIAGLMVNITSEVLNEMELKELDLFSTDLGLPGMTSGVAIQYQKSTIFNITELIPLIAGLAAPWQRTYFRGSRNRFGRTANDSKIDILYAVPNYL